MEVEIAKGDDAVAYLKRLQYRISRTTFYRHVQEGKLSPAPWTPGILDTYAKTHLQAEYGDRRAAAPASTQPTSAEAVDLQSERLVADTRAKLAMAELRELQLKIETGQFVDKEEHDRLLTLEIYIFRDCIRNFCRVVPPELAAKFDLDHELIPEMGDFLIEIAERELGQYHGKEFELIVHEKSVDNEKIAP